MEEIIEAQRDLGDGKWDKILKRKMVELSFADNYEEARNEWETTGKVYKHTHCGQEPDWVKESGHLGNCLCGRPIAYHFQVENTVTGVKEVVGSDHIGTYLIIRQLMKDLNIRQEDVTDIMIDNWLKERVQTMKSEAWWEENGEHFKEMFDTIAELDVIINSKDSYIREGANGYYYDYEPMKRAKGKIGDYGYKMASIVWRWNHEDNPKNQLTKYGYPNDRLWADLNLFYALRSVHRVQVEKQQEKLDSWNEALIKRKAERAEKARLRKEELERQRLEWEAGREERERLARIEAKRQTRLRKKRIIEQRRRANEIIETQSEVWEEMKDYYGFPEIDTDSLLSHELRSLAVIKQTIIEGKTLSSSHLHTLQTIFSGVVN
jgi:hypothetical protein